MSPKQAPKKSPSKKASSATSQTQAPAQQDAPDAAQAEVGEPAAKASAAAKPKAPAKRGAAKVAAEIIAAGDSPAVLKHAAGLEDPVERAASNAARVLQEIANEKPEMVVSIIDRFARLLTTDNPRVVQTCASALPQLARIAPAKVAKQLGVLTGNWERTNPVGRDGLVRAFAGLCTASVAYQKRLEPALARALREADPKTLMSWTEVVLPALKGEPHARARAVVEDRLHDIPRVHAQHIADFLGVKLRPLMR